VSPANTLAVAEHGAAASDNPFDAVTYTEEPTVDWTEALDGTDEIVERFRQENYVDVAEHFETDIYEGYGQLIDDTTIEVVDGLDKGTRIAGEKALIATGSSPWAPPIDGLDDVEYYTSETILDERDLPESISIIGGGYIALEWGQILHRVGVDITILQRSDRILSGMEVQLGREIQRAFREEGIDIVTGNDFQQVQSAAADGGTEAIQQGVTVETTVDGDSRVFTAEALFVATGVQPNSQNIGLEALGVETEPDGAIRVDECFQTTNSDIYAAGDVIGEPELETVAAAKEGNHVVKNAFGDGGHHRLQRRPGGRLHQSRGRRRRHDRTGVHERTRHLFLSDCPDGGRPAGKGCQEHGWARPGRQTPPRDRRNRRRPHGRPPRRRHDNGGHAGREVRPDRRRHHRHGPSVPDVLRSVQTDLPDVPA